MNGFLLFTALAFSTSQPATAGLAETLRSAAQAPIENGAAIGLSVAVAIGDEIVLAEGFGLAELEHDVAVDVDTMFRIGSITKQFTAALVMQQVEAGEIELDQDMLDFLPDYPTRGHQVTIRHLLTHTSGIQSYTDLGPAWGRTIPLELPHAELLALFQDKPFQFEPGSEFRYNNSGYYLLGMILEAVSDKSYAQLIQSNVVEPLELTRTRIGSNDAIIRNRAQGYRRVDGEVANDGLIGMSQPGAAGALLSTARELVLWQRALLAGKLIARPSYDQMCTPHLLSTNLGTGYGFGLTISQAHGQDVIQHGGGINGFNSQLSYFPETDVTVAVISNFENYSSSGLAAELSRLALTSLKGEN